ncbi:MAG: DPP IV N-terminal domain-containing protein [Planctomycetota bacterium]
MAEQSGMVRTAVAFVLASAILGRMSLQLGAEETQEEKDEYSTRLFIADSDGSNMRQLTNLPEYQKQGSPSWSLDGKLIAFDAWKPQAGETFSDCRVIVVDADGKNPREFPDAAMPSFSPGGHRIAVSRPAAGGVWVIDVNDPQMARPIQVDKVGWGTDWSRDGRIVFVSRRPSMNLTVVNIVEGTVDRIFDKEPSPYSNIQWNMAWSPDGKRVVFKGTTHDGKQHVVIATVAGPEPRTVVRFEGNAGTSFAWHPDGSRILFLMQPPQGKLYQIYWIAPDTKEPPQLLAGQDERRHYSDVSYSPDGKQILVSCHKRTPQAK